MIVTETCSGPEADGVLFGVETSKASFRMTFTELPETSRRIELRTNRLVNDTMGRAYLCGCKGRGPMSLVSSYPLS